MDIATSALGFLSRGNPRKAGFAIVQPKEKIEWNEDWGTVLGISL